MGGTNRPGPVLTQSFAHLPTVQQTWKCQVLLSEFTHSLVLRAGLRADKKWLLWTKTAVLSRVWPAYYGLTTAAESFRLVTLCSARYGRGQSTAPFCFTVEEQSGWEGQGCFYTRRENYVLPLVSHIPTSFPFENSLLLDHVKKGLCRYSVNNYIGSLHSNEMFCCHFVMSSH